MMKCSFMDVFYFNSLEMQTMTYYMFCILITQRITPKKDHGVLEKA